MNETNDQVIISQLIDAKHKEVNPELKSSEFFEYFVCSELLKNFDHSPEEIFSGLLGGGGDGGIDGLYFYLNSDLLIEEVKKDSLKRINNFEIYIIQAKRENGFKEEPINKIASSLNDLLPLGKAKNLTSVYNEKLLELVSYFKHAFKLAISSLPSIKFNVIYATVGTDVHPNVKRKEEEVSRVIKTHFDNAQVSVQFIGAKELLNITRRVPTRNGILELSETPISTTDGSYIALVPLKAYYGFITEVNGDLNKRIFDANVRDYQGSVTVNNAIQATLTEGNEIDFWHLNNGITVLCDNASQQSKHLTVENPQVINGLQTSHEIYNYFKRNPGASDTRRVLVRVIVGTDPTNYDRIIRASNSQTAIPTASLWGSDQFQRNIETLLLSRGLFYERRKNHYKNEGKPNQKLISIKVMAQSVQAILFQKPEVARARPSSLVDEEKDYRSLFSSEYPIEMYYVAITILKKSENYLRANVETYGIKEVEVNNLKYAHSMCVGMAMLGQRRNMNADNLGKIDPKKVTDTLLGREAKRVMVQYKALGKNDRTVKSRRMTANLLRSFKMQGNRNRKSG